ncbi:MAG TPA: HNH endonuclease [Chitinophagaceae bacterium]|nr:HNH endonuclease [Chitinophagaceae bacterium]
MDKLPFIPNHIYKRSDIHDNYGGNRQGGIAPSAKLPFIFIFSGKSGAQYGYKDGWDNPNIFSYTGEGQVGDMRFIKGNLALKDHINNGKRVFLFEYERTGYVKFISEMEFYDIGYFDTPDINKNTRVGIRFFFKRKGAYIPVAPEEFERSLTNEDDHEYGEIILPNKTERSGLVTSRVGQGAYRKRIIHRWEYQCAVTKFNKLEILIASHIVPWSKATDTERLDVHNGILLSPVYDALFDRKLISFDHNGKILLSESIEPSAYKKIGVTGKEVIQNLSQYNLKYLDRHLETLI